MADAFLPLYVMWGLMGLIAVAVFGYNVVSCFRHGCSSFCSVSDWYVVRVFKWLTRRVRDRCREPHTKIEPTGHVRTISSPEQDPEAQQGSFSNIDSDADRGGSNIPNDGEVVAPSVHVTYASVLAFQDSQHRISPTTGGFPRVEPQPLDLGDDESGRVTYVVDGIDVDNIYGNGRYLPADHPFHEGRTSVSTSQISHEPFEVATSNEPTQPHHRASGRNTAAAATSNRTERRGENERADEEHMVEVFPTARTQRSDVPPSTQAHRG